MIIFRKFTQMHISTQFAKLHLFFPVFINKIFTAEVTWYDAAFITCKMTEFITALQVKFLVMLQVLGVSGIVV